MVLHVSAFKNTIIVASLVPVQEVIAFIAVQED